MANMNNRMEIISNIAKITTMINDAKDATVRDLWTKELKRLEDVLKELA